MTADLPRAMGYAVLLRPFVWLGSLWLVVAFQAALSLYVLHLTAKAFGCPLDPIVAFGLYAGLAVFSTLSWTVSWVMPDIFAGLVVAGMSGIVAGTLTLPQARLAPLVVLTGVGATMHSTTLPMVLAMAIAGGVLAAWQVWSRRLQRTVARLLAVRLAAAAALAVGSTLAINLMTFGTPRLLPPFGTSIVLARFASDGLLQEHLERHCGSIAYRICEYRHELPREVDVFLWHPTAPFARLGGFPAMEDEARRLVAAIIQERPWAAARAFLANTLEQLLRFELAPDLRHASSNPGVLPIFESFGIRDLGGYKTALQHDPAFPPATVHGLHVAGLVAAVVILGALLVLGRLTAAQRVGLAFVLLGLAANAAVCGGLSAPTGRYNGRVVWLLPFFAAVLFLRSAGRAAADDRAVQ
jgi:hypothetical protein